MKIQDRIKLLRHRCEAGLGNNIFEKAYSHLKNKGDQMSQKTDELRKALVEILGEDMIGFWHLIDSLLNYEDLLKNISNRISNQ